MSTSQIISCHVIACLGVVVEKPTAGGHVPVAVQDASYAWLVNYLQGNDLLVRISHQFVHSTNCMASMHWKDIKRLVTTLSCS